MTITNTDKNPEQTNTDVVYKFTLSTEIKDIYDQHLEKPTDVTFKLMCLPFICDIKADRSGIIVYDPFLVTDEKPTYVVKTLNYKEFRVILYKMNPYTDLKKWGLENSHKEKSDTVDILGYGKKVFDQIIQVENFKKSAFISNNIDLRPALENGIGQVCVVVAPTIKG